MLDQKKYLLRLPETWKRNKRMGSRHIWLFQRKISTEFNQSRPLQISSKPFQAALLPGTQITIGRQNWKVLLGHQAKLLADMGCFLRELSKLHLTHCWFGVSQSCWKVLLNSLTVLIVRSLLSNPSLKIPTVIYTPLLWDEQYPVTSTVLLLCLALHSPHQHSYSHTVLFPAVLNLEHQPLMGCIAYPVLQIAVRQHSHSPFSSVIIFPDMY